MLGASLPTLARSLALAGTAAWRVFSRASASARSVSEQDVADAVFKQTTKMLEKKNISLPDIKLTGSYDVSVKLHPQVRSTRVVRILGAMLTHFPTHRSLPSSS